MKTVSIKSLNDSLKNVIKSIKPEISDNLISNLKRYQKIDLTKEIVDQYFKMFDTITTETNKMNIDEYTKNELLKAFSILISLMGQNECMGQIIMTTKEERDKYKEYADDLLQKLQNRTNKYNDLAKKYNEKQVDFELPKIDLSLTKRNKYVPYKIDAIIDIANSLGDQDLENKYKRFKQSDITAKSEGSQDYVNNLSHIYAKKSSTTNIGVK
jgi:hypothetical protein